jgi:hypothetical protein
VILTFPEAISKVGNGKALLIIQYVGTVAGLDECIIAKALTEIL